MTKNLFFDLDGTLINSSNDICIAVNEMLNNFNLSNVNVATVESIIGKGYPTTVRKVLSLFIEDNNKIESLATKGVEIVTKAYKKLDGGNTFTYPNVTKTLEYFKNQNIKMAVVTNKEEDSAKAILKRLELSGYFEIIVGGSTTPKYKPNPEPLTYAMTQLNAKEKESIMIGDSLNDYLCARDANIKTILVSYGYNNNIDLQSLNPHGLVSDFKDIIGFI